MAPSWQQLLIILVIVALIFGTKKLRNIGSDLGGAVKGFKDSITNDPSENLDTEDTEKSEQHSESDSEKG